MCRETAETRSKRIRVYQNSICPSGQYDVPARRCESNVVADFYGECEACGAANGEACLKPNS